MSLILDKHVRIQVQTARVWHSLTPISTTIETPRPFVSKIESELCRKVPSWYEWHWHWSCLHLVPCFSWQSPWKKEHRVKKVWTYDIHVPHPWKQLIWLNSAQMFRHCILWAIVYILWAIVCILWVIVYILWAIVCILWAIVYILWAIVYILWAIVYILWAIVCILWTIVCILWAIVCILSATMVSSYYPLVVIVISLDERKYIVSVRTKCLRTKGNNTIKHSMNEAFSTRRFCSRRRRENRWQIVSQFSDDFLSLLLQYTKVGGLIQMKHVIISFIFISFSEKVGSAGV